MAATARPRRPQVRIGTSGWVYPSWRGDFYPRGLPQREELQYLAARLNSVELNGSFYSLQRPQRYQAWAAATPDDFVFAVKGGRFITHLKKLVGVRTAVANFLASGVLALGQRLGPILWQLPERLPFEPDRTRTFLDLLPTTTAAAAALADEHDEKVTEDRAWVTTDQDRPLRHALEVRHRSWLEAEPVALLRRHGVALVVADSAGRWPMVDVPTADFAYARLHGDRELYTSGYSARALEQWARRVQGWTGAGRDVYVYLDNDAKGFAPHDAVALADLLGLAPART